MKKNIFLILVLLIVIPGCKKEKSLPPVIEIQEPASGEQYTYGDTIYYKFNVSDDQAVTNVKVSISNSAYQSVISYNFINAGKYKEFSGIFLTEGIPISGSTYHFVVSATDGENETKTGRQLTIFNSERKTVAVYAALAANSGSYEIIHIDTSYNTSPVMLSNGDFLRLQVSSKDQMIYTSGKFAGDIYAKRVNGPLIWSEPANSIGGNPAFQNISLHDDVIFVSYDNEMIKGYDNNKNIKFNANTGVSNYAVNVIKKDNIVLTEERSYPYIETKLTSYYYGSGAPIKSKSIGEVKIIKFFIKNDDQFVVIGNNNNQGKIFYYDFLLNDVWQPYQIPAGDSIFTAEYISTDHSILIQMTSGLYKFNLSNNNLIPIQPGANYEVLKFDNVKSELITASGTIINYYSYPQLQLIYSLNTSAPVKALEILYNR